MSVQVNGLLAAPPAETPQWNYSLCGQGACKADDGWSTAADLNDLDARWGGLGVARS